MLDGSGYGCVSYLGKSKPLRGERDPGKLFSRVFAGGTGGGGATPVVDAAGIARLQSERKSILDGVGKTYQGLSSKLGLADRDKIDSHVTMVRDLEGRLAVAAPTPGTSAPTPAGSSCPKAPTAPGTLAIAAQAGAYVDIMTTAIACDLTRVGTLQWDRTTGNSVYSFLGVNRGHYDLTHDGDDVAATVSDLAKLHTFYMQQLAALATRLKAIPEGNGTALDNTLILHLTDLARGNNGHTLKGLYHMLMGHAGGALKTRRWLKFNGNANNQLFVSILNMFDIPATSFGNATLSQGPLPGLV